VKLENSQDINNIWNIRNIFIGKHRLFEIEDPDYPDKFFPDVFLSLINCKIKSFLLIGLTQYIDENQGMLPDGTNILHFLQEEYDLKIIKSVSYTSNITPNIHSKKYIINIFGKPDVEWLRKILFFGGTGIPNIVYGFNEYSENWLDIMQSGNQYFSSSYDRKRTLLDILNFQNKAEILCWTSDNDLSIIVVNKDNENILKKEIQELSEKYLLIPNIVDINKPYL
jgi:hypothetical protein